MARKRAARLPIEDVVSAGGVVYRNVDGTVEVVICGRAADGVWGLPKGTPQSGESLEETAVREVTEETGLRVAIEAKIGQINYWFSRPQESRRYHKTVHYYLMRSTGGSTDYHDHEFDQVEWHSVDEACALLTYENEVQTVRQAQQLIQQRAGEESPE